MSNVPAWWPFLLIALAAFRTWKLISADLILDAPRERLSEGVQEWLSCAYCSGFWTALAWYAAWLAWPHGTLIAATPLALSAALAALATLLSSD